MTHPSLPVDATSIETMEAIGRAGLTISVCCGPSGAHAFRWTVQVLSRDGREFARPYAAKDFDHAIAIAVTEVTIRGWL
jgi:hypothetical protein